MSILDLVRKAADDVAALETKREAARAEGAAACAEIERIEAAKLDQDDYAGVERLDREAARQRWIVDHAAKRVTELDALITTAKAEKQKRAIAQHRAATAALYPKFRRAVEEAARLQAEAMALRKAASAELGEHVVQVNIPVIAFQGFLFPDLVALWTRNMDPVFAPPVKASAPPAPQSQARAQRLAANARPAASLQHAVVLGNPEPGPTHAAPLPDDLAPLGDGDEVRAKVIRAGYPDIEGRQSQRGRVIRVRKGNAQAALLNGAIEILPEEASK